MSVNAYQQHTSYFIESTVPTNGVGGKWGQDGYTYGVTDTSAVLANTANALVSYPFGYRAASIATKTVAVNTVPRNHFSGTKFLCGMNVIVAYDDVAAVLSVSASYDGTNWVDVDTLIADTTPNVTGVKQEMADLSTTYAPYYRLTFNSSGLNCGTSGTAKFFYCVPNPS